MPPPGNSSPVPDHPRSRGEYFSRAFITIREPGSSPLSRGILWPVSVVVDLERIIPALAGNTLHIETWDAGRWDHPRSRGEYKDMFPAVA